MINDTNLSPFYLNAFFPPLLDLPIIGSILSSAFLKIPDSQILTLGHFHLLLNLPFSKSNLPLFHSVFITENMTYMFSLIPKKYPWVQNPSRLIKLVHTYCLSISGSISLCDRLLWKHLSKIQNAHLHSLHVFSFNNKIMVDEIKEKTVIYFVPPTNCI